MPPLQAPPEDGEGWYAEEEPANDRRGGRRKWAWLAVSLALILLLAGGAWLLLGDGNGNGNGTEGNTAQETSAATSSAAGPTGIQLDGSFIGRPADDVEAELEGAGLLVRRQAADAELIDGVDEDLAAGDIAGLDPTDVFAPPGTAVTLFVVPEAEDDEPAETSESAEPTSAAPSTTAAPTTSIAPDPTTAASSNPATSASGSAPATLSGQPEPSEPAAPTTTAGEAGPAASGSNEAP
jgi:serine/threonine-protein kinase